MCYSCMSEAAEGGMYLLEVLEAIRFLLLCILEAIDGGLSLAVSKFPSGSFLVIVCHYGHLRAFASDDGDIHEGKQKKRRKSSFDLQRNPGTAGMKGYTPWIKGAVPQKFMP